MDVLGPLKRNFPEPPISADEPAASAVPGSPLAVAEGGGSGTRPARGHDREGWCVRYPCTVRQQVAAPKGCDPQRILTPSEFLVSLKYARDHTIVGYEFAVPHA